MIKKLEYWWRHHIVYPVVRRIFHNTERSLPIDIQSIKSILVLRYDRIGDMIVTTPIFKSLKAAHPHLRIGVLASTANAEIIQHNYHVDKIHILPVHWWQIGKEMKIIRNEHYDMVLNLVFNRTTTGGILANMIAPEGIKIGQGAEKYRFYFNTLLQLNREGKHMVETLLSILNKVFGLQLSGDSLRYDIMVDHTTKGKIQEYWAKYHLQPRGLSEGDGSPYVVFNLSAYDTVRRISTEQALLIGKYLASISAYRTILLHAPNDSLMAAAKKHLLETTPCLPFPEHGTASLLEIAAMIEGASMIITPDTSIIHFASAAQTPIIGFYTSMQDAHEWLPFRVNHKIILSEINQPTSSIPGKHIIEEMKEFMKAV